MKGILLRMQRDYSSDVQQLKFLNYSLDRGGKMPNVFFILKIFNYLCFSICVDLKTIIFQTSFLLISAYHHTVCIGLRWLFF